MQDKNKARVNIDFVEAENLTSKNISKTLKNSDAISVLVVLEKEAQVILACKYARINNIPYT